MNITETKRYQQSETEHIPQLAVDERLEVATAETVQEITINQGNDDGGGDDNDSVDSIHNNDNKQQTLCIFLSLYSMHYYL